MQNYLKLFMFSILAMALVAQTGCAAIRPGTHSCVPGGSVGSYKAVAESDIAALFDRWNEAIRSQDPRKVVSLYADGSILLATLSGKPRITATEKEEYFRSFLAEQPSASIEMRRIEISGDMASDSGLYDFTLARTGKTIRARYSFVYRRYGARWLIVSHHSSLLPEKTE